jgi:tape measure domain-containing protein
MSLLSYAMSLKTGGFDRPLSASRGLLTGFGSTVVSTGAKLGKLAIGFGAIAAPIAGATLAFKAFTAAADLESTQIALRTLVGDVELADATLQKVRRLAASTPFQFPELANSTRKLIAFEESAQTVPTTLRRIGDVAAGVQAPIEELAELYGKARVQGTLYAEDINQLMERGIPILQQVAKVLGVNASEVKKLASEGKITFPLLEQSFINLTSEGGKFFQMMKAQSATTNGLMSTLKDSANEIFLVIGQPLNDAFKPVLTGAIERSKLFGIQLQGIIELFKEAGSQGQIGGLIGTSLQVAGINFINLVSGGFRGAVAFLGATIPKIFSEAGGLLFNTSLIQVVSRIFTAAGLKIQQGGVLAAAAIVKALPGGDSASESLFGLADSKGRAAQIEFNIAGQELAYADLGKELQDFTDGFSAAMSDGSAAWKKSTDEALIDGGPALARWEKMAKELNPNSAGRILDPSSFLPKELTETGSNEAEGLKAAIEAVNGAKKVEKTKIDQQISALNRNTAALARPVDKPGLDKPLGGGAIFSAAETLAKKFANPDNRQGKSFNRFIAESLGGRRAVREFANKNDLSLADARERLVALAGGANPAQGRKPAGKDPQIEASRAMLTVVKSIEEKFENLATA